MRSTKTSNFHNKQHDHHHHVNTQGSSSSAKRIVSPSPPSSSLLQSTATSPRQFVSKPNFKPKSPYVKQLNHIDHQATPSEIVDSPRSDKSRSSYGRLSSPAHETHVSKTHHKPATTSKLKPLASSVPQSKQIKATKNQHSHPGKKPTPIVQRINLMVDEGKRENQDLPPPYLDQKNEDKIFLEEEARSLLIETKESLVIKPEYGDSEGKSKSAIEESLTKSHFFPKKDHNAVHHPEHEYSEYTLPGDYYVAEIPSRDVEAEGGYIIEEGHSSEREFLETGIDVKINEQPITLNSARKLNIPRFAHELSHQKIYDRQSFGERRLSTGEILPTLENKITSSSTNKAYYFDILKELEQTPLSIRHDKQASYLINKADKVDQATFIILSQKLGSEYSQSLYRIFSKYVGSNEEHRTKMNFTKLLAFARDFGLLTNKFHKEELSLIFTKRCPHKTIDFPGFVDILFKIGKRTGDIHELHDHEKNPSFQAYLDKFVLSQHHQILEKQLSPRFAPVSAFGKEYGPENEALRLLEGHDDLLKHVFTLYKSIDIQFSNKSVVTLKDFKLFCHDFQIVPALVSFTEVHEVFKRFQLNEKPILDFRGFVLSLCCIANIGYDKEHHKQKYDTYTKRLIRFFALLVGMNNRIANQLVANNIRKLKE